MTCAEAEAKADLHAANEALADTVVGTVVTKQSSDAALVQNLHIEGQLHDAVNASAKRRGLNR
jgi:hypothetical protein